MKKLIAALVLTAMAVSFATALDMSAGAGVTFSPVFGSYKAEVGSYSSDVAFSSTYLGVNGFFDATYAVANVGMNFSLSNTYDGEDTKMSYSNLTLGLLGKYPIAVGSATIFPLLGFEYDANLSAKYDGEDVKADMDSDAKSDLNSFWLKGGVGADIGINEKLYVRPSALFGYKFQNKGEKDAIKLIEDADGTASINTFKLDLGLAVGYKL